MNHEDLNRTIRVETSSDRSFGVVFTVVFVLIGLYPLLFASTPHYWALAIAAVFLALALFKPALLAAPNRWWAAFGALLHRIVNPIILGIMFFIVVTPIGLLMRMLGKDLLRLQLQKNAGSYWIEREPPGPAADSFGDQF